MTDAEMAAYVQVVAGIDVPVELSPDWIERNL